MLESKPMFSTKPFAITSRRKPSTPNPSMSMCRCVDDDDDDDDDDDNTTLPYTTWRLCIKVVLHIMIGER